MSQQNAQEETKKYPVGVSAKFAAGTIVASLPVELLAHLGPTGVLVGGLASYVAWKHGPEVYEAVRERISILPPLEKALAADQAEQIDNTGKIKPAQKKHTRSFWDRAWGNFPEGYFDSDDDDQVQGDDQAPKDDQGADPDLFAQVEEAASLDAGVRRLTIDEIVAHTTRNSYEVYLGRSMVKIPGNKPVKINFYRRHIKIIGASSYGKTSLATALMECIMRTHDSEKVMFSLLDLENKASRLFANADHLAEYRVDGQWIPAHARNEEEVLQHLEYIVDLMNFRYTLPETELETQPLLIVYLEEFIDLKDHFKRAIDKATTKEAKEVATKNYNLLVYYISKIARRGLKVLIQFLMCAQVDYADEDLKEALANVVCGLSFCVRPTAAASAGFYQTALIRKNILDNKKGQAVCEMPECKDIILTPEYDLGAKLKALSEHEQKQNRSIVPELPDSARKPNLSVVPTLQGASEELPEKAANEPVAHAELAPEGFQARGDDLLLSELQEELLKVFYGKCGSVGKSLEQIRNEKGQGLGGRYTRHASYVLEQCGLKKARA